MARFEGVLALLLMAALVGGFSAEEQLTDHAPIHDASGPGEPVTVRLTPSRTRKKEDARALAARLKALPELVGASVTTVSRDVLVLVPSRRHSTEQLTRLLLQQPEVYELEVGAQLHRRDGDKPYDQARREILSEVVADAKARLYEKVKDKFAFLSRKRREAPSSEAQSDESTLIVDDGAAEGQGLQDGAKKRTAKRARRKDKRRRRKSTRGAAAKKRADPDGAGDDL